MQRKIVRSLVVVLSVLVSSGQALAGIATGFFAPQPNSSITFPAQAVGTATVQTRSLVATTSGPTVLQITADSVSGPDFLLNVPSTTCAVGTNYPNGAACTVGVQFAPTASVTRSGTFSLTCTALNVIGALTLVCDGLAHTFSLFGTGFAASAPIATPTLGQWGVTVLAMLLLAVAMIPLRRSRR